MDDLHLKYPFRSKEQVCVRVHFLLLSPVCLILGWWEELWVKSSGKQFAAPVAIATYGVQSTVNMSFPCALLPTWNSKQVMQCDAKGIYFWSWAPEPLRLLTHKSFELHPSLWGSRKAAARNTRPFKGEPLWQSPEKSQETHPEEIHSMTTDSYSDPTAPFRMLAIPKPWNSSSKAVFLSPGSVDIGACPEHRRMFNSIPGVYALDDTSTYTHTHISWDNQKCL